MKIDEELQELHGRLDVLEQGPASLGDWHRLDARVARALLQAQQLLTSVQQDMVACVRTDPPDPTWRTMQTLVARIRDAMDEMHVIRMCAQSRVFELQAGDRQDGFSNWS